MSLKRFALSIVSLGLALVPINLNSAGVIQAAQATITAQRLVTQVIEKRPHDPTAFTEGFQLDHGILYESSGLDKLSNLRAEDPSDGQPTLMVPLPPTVFGEGIAINGDQLVQLTWKANTAYVYDLHTLQVLKTFQYEGEGWGLCFDGQDYYMSNGSAMIAVRDPQTFALIKSIPVDLDGVPIDQLNELECVGDSVYANVWMTDNILQIDKTTGHVIALIDASGLITPEERQSAGTDGVLNGITYDPQANDFLITGKLWPWMFVVRFVPPTEF